MSKRRWDNSGQSLIEMAFALPVLLLTITGIFACGITFNNFLLLSEGTGTAARQLAISRGTTMDPCATTAAALYSTTPMLNKTEFTLSLSLNGNAYSGTSCNSSSYTTGAAGNLMQGKPIVLTVNYPCSLKFFSQNLIPNCSLKAVTTEIAQ